MSKANAFFNVIGKVFMYALEQADKNAGLSQRNSYQQRKEIERMMKRSDLSEQQRQYLQRKSEILDEKDEIIKNYYTSRDDIDQIIKNAYDNQDKKEKEIFEYKLRNFVREQGITTNDYTILESMKDEEFIVIFVQNRLDSEGENFNIELAQKYALEIISEIRLIKNEVASSK